MKIRRTVPNIKSDHPQQSRTFYEDFLGLKAAMNRDEIITFASPSNRTAQISVMKQDDAFAPLHPDISIEVENVDQVYSKAKEQGIEIMYPITNEPWGLLTPGSWLLTSEFSILTSEIKILFLRECLNDISIY